MIESRAASELGRNVKLLTYVSIFYLPLSFCAVSQNKTRTEENQSDTFVVAMEHDKHVQFHCACNHYDTCSLNDLHTCIQR